MDKQPKQPCPCTYPCSRHGNCHACREYHHSTGSKTNCEKNDLKNKK